MVLSFLTYLLNGQKIHILLAFIFLTLAFATKLYASLLFIPAFFVVLILNKKLKDAILNWYFFSGLSLFLASSVTLVYLREMQTPGYIDAIIFNDAGRLFTAFNEKVPSSSFYLDNIFVERFSYGIILFLLGTMAVFYKKDIKNKLILNSVLICLLSYFLIINFSKTKMVWYDMPMYPLLSIIAAYPIVLLLKLALDQERKNKNLLKVVFMGIVFSYPLFLMFRQSQDNTIFMGDKIIESNEMFLYDGYKKNKNLDGVKVYYHGWDGSLLFY